MPSNWIQRFFHSRFLYRRDDSRTDSVRGVPNFCPELLNNSPNGCAVVIDGIFQFVNPSFTRLLKQEAGDSVQACFGEESWNVWKDSVEKGIPVEKKQVSFKTADTKNEEILVSVKPFKDNGKDSFLLFCGDITEFRKNEESLKAAKTAAEALVKQKGEFLANMSHEIRTPMNAVLGMTYLALRTELTPKQREYLERVEQSAKLLLRIINDILDFSKIEAGRLVMEYREFILQQTIDDLKNLVAESVQKKNIELIFETSTDVPVNVMGDSVRLRQVLINLISNAVKFTGEDGKIVLRIETAEQDGLSVLLRFTVQDNGIGMTAEQIQRLFTPFSQADSSTTRRFGGTGLGLAISKRIVEMMKGEINCSSIAGEGTKFTFTVRLGLPLEGELLEVPQEVKTVSLILGDRPATVSYVKNSLELLSCSVAGVCLTVEDLKVFLQSVPSRNVDFILFDFDNLTTAADNFYKILSEHYGEGLPKLVFSTDADTQTLETVMKSAVPLQQIRYPIDLTALFNVLTQIAAEKKLRSVREKEKTLNTESSSKTTFNIPESLRGIKILLAEDNRINQIVATEMLQLAGFDVECAGNGKIAVEMVSKKDYDLVLMDIQMPEMDGLEATRKIRMELLKQDLPIVALSADAMSGDAERSLAAGMNAHITKPIDPPQLLNAVVNLVQKNRGS